MYNKTIVAWFVMALSLLLSFGNARAVEDTLYRPFILASKGPGDMAGKIEEVKAALSKDFEIAGEYSPYENAHVIAVTNAELRRAAAGSEHGGYAAAQRVSLTKVGADIQVAYTNPVYMAHAYRLNDSLEGAAQKLEAALGRMQDFGASGLTAKALRGYHYTFGMEYFTDPYQLVDYGSYEQAVAAVEKALAEHKGGATKVYRIDIPGKQETVFGVGLRAGPDGDKYMDDQFIMSVIDFKDLRQTAHLPYEILVSGRRVYALHARFRIAISFPDLKMMGERSFMKIMPTPDALGKALTVSAGGKPATSGFSF